VTTIVGVRLGDTVALAADRRSACNGGSDIVSETQTKLLRAGSWALGSSGSRRLFIVAERHAAKLAETESIFDFCEVLRRLLRDDGWKVESADPGPASMGAQGIVVARPSGLWHLGADFGYGEIAEGWPIATGSGCDWAEGAATAALRMGATPVQAVRMGVEAAARYDAYTGQGLDIMELGPEVAVEATDARACACKTGYAQGEHGASRTAQPHETPAAGATS
jgi:ATP-dependent protease HslVU (ClpYQ) peptidase subunit